MIKLYEGQKESIYKIQKESGLNKGTLYKYTKGTPIEKMETKTLINVALYLNMRPGELYKKIQDYQNKKD